MNREDFEILSKDVVYLDNGATTLKPKCVIDEMMNYYNEYTSNIHRGDYDFAIKTNEKYDGVRALVKDLINAESSDEIIFNSGSTFGLNQVVFGFMKNELSSGDEVLITKAEHASNALPWIVLEEEIGIKVKYIDLNDEFSMTLDNLKKAITDKTKVISIAHISNVIGDVRDTEEIGKICKEEDIYFVVDGAQSVSHIEVDVRKSNIDFLAFSGHKMMGPTGVGVLYGKKELLEKMKPIVYGGGMNQYFEADGTYELSSIPSKFESGTPPIAEVIGLGEAIKYINKIGIDNIHKHELELRNYLVEKLEKMENIILYNKNSESGIVTFNIKDVFSQDTSVYLNHYNICIRSGNHCAKMLKDYLDISNTCRISLYLYNNKEDVDRLVAALEESSKLYEVVI